jgi:hypothetical protein
MPTCPGCASGSPRPSPASLGSGPSESTLRGRSEGGGPSDSRSFVTASRGAGRPDRAGVSGGTPRPGAKGAHEAARRHSRGRARQHGGVELRDPGLPARRPAARLLRGMGAPYEPLPDDRGDPTRPCQGASWIRDVEGHDSLSAGSAAASRPRQAARQSPGRRGTEGTEAGGTPADPGLTAWSSADTSLAGARHTARRARCRDRARE